MGPVWAPTSVQNGANKPYLLPFYATILPFLPPSGRSRSPLTIYQTVSLGSWVNKAKLCYPSQFLSSINSASQTTRRHKPLFATPHSLHAWTPRPPRMSCKPRVVSCASTAYAIRSPRPSSNSASIRRLFSPFWDMPPSRRRWTRTRTCWRTLAGTLSTAWTKPSVRSPWFLRPLTTTRRNPPSKATKEGGNRSS